MIGVGFNYLYVYTHTYTNTFTHTCTHPSIKNNEIKRYFGDFLGGAVVKNPPANEGETRVGSLVWEDPTCSGATKPVCHNY